MGDGRLPRPAPVRIRRRALGKTAVLATVAVSLLVLLYGAWSTSGRRGGSEQLMESVEEVDAESITINDVDDVTAAVEDAAR